MTRSWTVGSILSAATGFLESKSIEGARLDSEVLLAHVLGSQRIDLYLNFHRPIDADERARYRKLIGKRSRNAPAQHLTGRQDFFGLTFEVGPETLIPRPDTEVLVEESIRRLKNGGASGLVVDVGAGSGNIAVSLAKYCPGNYKFIGTDISGEALKYARRNIRRHEVEDIVFLIRGDLFAGIAGDAPIAAVVANPPYIREDEFPGLQPEVRDREPRIALDGGKDGLRIYRSLIPEAFARLAPGGFCAVEIGFSQEDEVVGIFSSTGFSDVICLQDYAGRPRVVRGVRAPQ